MKTTMVERKTPENWKECDQLYYTHRCCECAYHSISCNCNEKKLLYEKAVLDGELREVRDSNGEGGYVLIIKKK